MKRAKKKSGDAGTAGSTVPAQRRTPMQSLALAFKSLGAWMELNVALSNFWRARFDGAQPDEIDVQRWRALMGLALAIAGGHREADAAADRIVAALYGAKDVEDESVHLRDVEIVVSNYVNKAGRVEVNPIVGDIGTTGAMVIPHLAIHLATRFGWTIPAGKGLGHWFGAHGRIGVIARILVDLDPRYQDRELEEVQPIVRKALDAKERARRR